MPSQRTEVYALRYGTRSTTKSEVYLNYDVYGEPDAPVGMDYYFWVVRRGDRVVVVDCGYNADSGGRRGRTMLLEPVEGLRRLGITPAGVSALVLTHGHYDHIGNLGAFETTPLVMARSEYEFWTGPDSDHEMFRHSAEADDLARLRKAGAAGRIRFVAGTLSLGGGILLTELGGHTPGQLVVTVWTEEGTVVIASDAVHYYEEYTLQRPFRQVADLIGMYRGFDRIRDLTRGDDRLLLPGHDPEVMTRYPACDGELAGHAVCVA
jgi:glyoxylase-like metal-dependent hydrolase (beta-lactamase superfamily II)